MTNSIKKRPDWKEYGLLLAAAAAKRSTCLRRHYGAVIMTQDHKVVSMGYNGAARGQDNCSDTGECLREKMNIPHGERYELCRAVHAEMNAIVNGDPEQMKGATIYIYGETPDGTVVDSAPCLLCQRVIANACIHDVVYMAPGAPVSYLVNPKEKDLYGIRVSFGILDDQIVCLRSKSEYGLSEKVAAALERQSEWLSHYIEEELKQKFPNQADMQDIALRQIKIEVHKPERIQYNPLDMDTYWIIPDAELYQN